MVIVFVVVLGAVVVVVLHLILIVILGTVVVLVFDPVLPVVLLVVVVVVLGLYIIRSTGCCCKYCIRSVDCRIGPVDCRISCRSSE